MTPHQPSDPSDPSDPSEEAQATPDELLLELMDLVTLAFPTSLYHMRIEIRPSDDGKRPALSNLDGKGRMDAPKRPELGFDDDHVLDAINGLLVELGTATKRQGDVMVLDGALQIDDIEDGARFCELLQRDDSGAFERVMTRRFDRSELRWLLYTPQLFSLLNDSAAREQEQQRAVDQALLGLKRFDIDMKKGVIRFDDKVPLDQGGKQAQFNFELLGSYLDESKRFMWGWGNDAVGDRLVRSVDAIRRASTGEGLRAFSEADFGCPELCAYRLARHAAVVTDALGVYRAAFAGTQGKGFMYLALRKA